MVNFLYCILKAGSKHFEDHPLLKGQTDMPVSNKNPISFWNPFILLLSNCYIKVITNYRV